MFTHKFLQDWNAALDAAATAVQRTDEVSPAELGTVPGLKVSSTVRAGGMLELLEGVSSLGCYKQFLADFMQREKAGDGSTLCLCGFC